LATLVAVLASFVVRSLEAHSITSGGLTIRSPLANVKNRWCRMATLLFRRERYRTLGHRRLELLPVMQRI
jgi:hypothetical protein